MKLDTIPANFFAGNYYIFSLYSHTDESQWSDLLKESARIEKTLNELNLDFFYGVGQTKSNLVPYVFVKYPHYNEQTTTKIQNLMDSLGQSMYIRGFTNSAYVIQRIDTAIKMTHIVTEVKYMDEDLPLTQYPDNYYMSECGKIFQILFKKI